MLNIQLYTANIGNHDPERLEENGLKVITEDIMDNPLLSARFYKCCPHLLFPFAEWAIWIDANVWLHKPIKWFINYVEEQKNALGYNDYGLFSHYFRRNAWEEAEAEKQAMFEDKIERIDRTMGRYRFWEQNGDGFSSHLSQNFIFVRKNTELNAKRNEAWWMEICRGSRRDQLSLELFYPGPYWPTVDFTKSNEFFTRISE